MKSSTRWRICWATLGLALAVAMFWVWLPWPTIWGDWPIGIDDGVNIGTEG